MSENSFITRPSPRARRYETFAAFFEPRRHWTFKDGDGGTWNARAQRVFQYPNHSAILWAELINGHFVEAHVSVPFSGGPEKTINGGSMEEVIGWIKGMENLLMIPCLIAEANTPEEVLERMQRIKRHDLFLMQCIFDLDGYNEWMTHRRIIEFCAKPRVVERLKRDSRI